MKSAPPHGGLKSALPASAGAASGAPTGTGAGGAQVPALQRQRKLALAERARRATRRSTAAFIEAYRPCVQHPSHGMVRYEPYPFQRDLLEQLDAGGRIVVLKARQTGISTTFMLQKLMRCLNPGTTVLIASRKQTLAAHLIRIARDAVQSCERPYPLKVTTDNALELGFANGSRIAAESSTPDTGRGYAVSDLILDEAAYLPWQEEMWRSVSPAVAHGQSLAMLGSPNMEGDLFHRTWEAAQLPGSGWRSAKITWEQHPEYDQDWHDRLRPDYTAAAWAQEFCCEFGHSADAVFGREYIQRALELGAAEWKRKPKHAFALGVDVAGSGQDESVIVTLERTERPARVVSVQNWEQISAPSLQTEIENAAKTMAATPWVDRTGIGWGITENLRTHCVAVMFTGGNSVTGTMLAPNIPREILINHLVRGLEEEQIAIPAGFQGVVLGLRGYRWGTPKALYADYVDALALAWWSATKGEARKLRVREKPQGM